jgi:hypothetical protein
MIDYGLSVVDADTIRGMLAPGEFADLAALQTLLSADRRLGGYEVFQRFYEIGSPTGLAELDALIRARSG